MKSLRKIISESILKKATSKKKGLQLYVGKVGEVVWSFFLSTTTLHLILQLINYEVTLRISSKNQNSRYINSAVVIGILTQDISVKVKVTTIIRYDGPDNLVI